MPGKAGFYRFKYRSGIQIIEMHSERVFVLGNANSWCTKCKGFQISKTFSKNNQMHNENKVENHLAVLGINQSYA